MYGKVTIRKDHRPLLVFNHAGKQMSVRLAKWMAEFSGYDCVIEYEPGKFQEPADALSRAPQRIELGDETLAEPRQYLHAHMPVNAEDDDAPQGPLEVLQQGFQEIQWTGEVEKFCRVRESLCLVGLIKKVALCRNI